MDTEKTGRFNRALDSSSSQFARRSPLAEYIIAYLFIAHDLQVARAMALKRIN